MITTSSVRLETSNEHGGTYAFLDSVSVLAGFGVGVYFYPSWSFVVLAEKEGRNAIIALPSERWKQDLADDGWSIKQVLSFEDVPNAHVTKEGE